VLLRVDPLAPEPIFGQIVFQVKARVARGELGPGDQLPSVRELAKELAINPNTVARAYGELESQGVIVRRQGAGCFVTGAQSALKLEERRRQLAQLVDRTVTEASHLGFDAAAVRAAFEKRLRSHETLQEKRK
jgi:GntR family transcriptional regulator